MSFSLSGTLHSFRVFLLSARGKWTKNHYPLFHQSTLRPTEQDVTNQGPSKIHVSFSFLSLLNLKMFWYLYSIGCWWRLGGIGRSRSCKKKKNLSFRPSPELKRHSKPSHQTTKAHNKKSSRGGGGQKLIKRRGWRGGGDKQQKN